MMVRLFILLIAILSPSWSWAAVAYDASASSQCDATADATIAECTSVRTVLTYSLTVGSGSNRQLGVMTFVGCRSSGTAPAVTSVTYAGTTLTQQTSNTTNAPRKGYLHTWPTGSQPTSGANNVVVTVDTDLITGCGDSYGNIMSGAIAVTGVDQSTTLSSSANNTGTSGTSLTLTIGTSGANDLGIHGGCTGSTMSSTTETSRYTTEYTENSCGSMGGATASGGDTSFSWTSAASDSWVMVGGAFKESGGGGGPTCSGALLMRGVGGC
jgi:hypothetical protein